MNQTTAKARATRAPSSDGRAPAGRKAPAKKAAAPRTPARKPPAGTDAAGYDGGSAKAPARIPASVRFQVEALQNVSTPIMMTDSDLVIYYMNDAAEALMRSAETEFRQIWPGFSADNLVGQCIDQFHVNPEHQRRLLADPTKLPYHADIKVGRFSFGLHAAGQFDDNGELVGTTLEWENLTELLDVQSKMATIDRSQGVAEYELDGTIITANQNFLDMLGYGLDEIVGKHHQIFCDRDLANSRDYREMWTNLLRGERQEGDHKRRNERGELVWLRASYNPVFDRKGKPVKIVEFATEITEAKAAEAEAKFRAEALGQVRTAIMMVDRDFNIYYINEAATGLMRRAEPKFRQVWPGFSADNLLGQCIDQFHEKPEHQRRLLNDPSNLPYRADIQVADMSFGLNVTAQIDPDGNYVGCTLEWEDLTELLDVKSKIDAIDRGQAMIEFALDGTILTANDNFVKRMGYGLDEMVGRHHRMFVDPADAASPAYALLWDKLGRGQFDAGEYRRFTKSGEEVWLRASYNPVVDRQGNAVKVVKFASDITQEKHFQQAIQNLVGQASSVMGAVAEGDLTRAIEGDFQGDLVMLQEATNRSIENLAGLVTKIRGSAASMSTSAKEVALANQDLSRRTEAQASSLEETASSMEEMTATVQQNADNARKASQLAVSAREQAQDGGQVVDRAVDAMRAISESSKKIADIIGVIDEIAFQTNLLALNAAVEAARAGDQGRGFAVVASEVRNLAQRSAGAAKEIKALINDSLAKVDDGSNLVNQSGGQLQEIVNSVKKVSDIIAEIAAASEEQSAGIGQVNQAVAEMDHGTQQNAAMVEEAAAASDSMQQQSRALLELTQQFKVGGADDVAPVAAEPMVGHTPRTFDQMARRTAPSTPAAATAPAESAPATAADDEAWQEF